MSYARAPSSDFWIIGYGNPQRRDDGIGPYIVKRLQPLLGHRSDVHLRVLHQLEPDVIDTLKNAHTILFVDATLRTLAQGRHWVGIQPELNTGGGTSDGRFIAPLGTEVLEFGLLNQSIHQVNENTSTDDLEALSRVYRRVMGDLLIR